MKYDNQLRYAADIVRQYDGRVPLSAWLKDFFRLNKQMGSRDRKTVSEMVYGYYRLGHNHFNSIEERIVSYLLLSSSFPEVSEYFRQKFTSATINHEEIFPYTKELSGGIDAVAFAKSFLQQPDLFLRIRPDHKASVMRKLNEHSIAFQLCGEDCVAVANSTRIETVLDINREVVVQDKSSQATGELMRQVAVHCNQPKVWDCCAASGGKSIMAYDIFEKIDLTVSDIRESIIQNLQQRFKEAAIFNYNPMVMDVTKEQQLPKQQYDLVIADVPCSGSGTWARTPEQLYFFKKDRISFYSDLQKKITAAVTSSIKPGGYLLYITCSVFAEENEQVVSHLKLNHHLTEVSTQLFKGYNEKADTLFASLLTNQSS